MRRVSEDNAVIRVDKMIRQLTEKLLFSIKDSPLIEEGCRRVNRLQIKSKLGALRICEI
jgi:hypothetical protein